MQGPVNLGPECHPSYLDKHPSQAGHLYLRVKGVPYASKKIWKYAFSFDDEVPMSNLINFKILLRKIKRKENGTNEIGEGQEEAELPDSIDSWFDSIHKQLNDCLVSDMDENQPREISNNDLLFGETFFVTLNVHTGKMFLFCFGY